MLKELKFPRAFCSSGFLFNRMHLYIMPFARCDCVSGGADVYYRGTGESRLSPNLGQSITTSRAQHRRFRERFLMLFRSFSAIQNQNYSKREPQNTLSHKKLCCSVPRKITSATDSLRVEHFFSGGLQIFLLSKFQCREEERRRGTERTEWGRERERGWKWKGEREREKKPDRGFLGFSLERC